MHLPPYDIFPIIEGPIVCLREIQTKDLPDILEISYYNALKAASVDEASLMLERINRDYEAGKAIHWGIADSHSDKLVGTCGYYRGLDMGYGELGFVLLAQHQGKGYMTAAITLAMQFGLVTIGLKRIWAETTLDNKLAIALLKRLNFSQEALLEDNGVIFAYQQ